MNRAYVSDVLAHDVDTVWSTLGDFHGVATWIAMVRDNAPEGGTGRADVGAVRVLTLEPDGQLIRERLVAYNAVDRTQSYEVDGALPYGMTEFLGTLRVSPITATGDTFLEWYCDFSCATDDTARIRETMRSVYTEFVVNLRQHLQVANT
jgi:hypothetical protein